MNGICRINFSFQNAKLNKTKQSNSHWSFIGKLSGRQRIAFEWNGLMDWNESSAIRMISIDFCISHRPAVKLIERKLQSD